MFDTIVADRLLQCVRCGAMEEGAAFLTHMRAHPQGERFHVGDLIEIDWDDMRGSRYLPVEPSSKHSSETVNILDQWDCSVCGSVDNWAQITIRDGRIESIEPRPLNQETLRRVHFINDDVKGVAAAMTDRKFTDLSYEEVIPLLKRILP